MIIRHYKASDLDEIIRLFYDTVHTINAKDYTNKQLNAWADGNIDKSKWNQSLSANFTAIANLDGKIVGFGDIDNTGYLNRLYVHKDYQNQGIATAICNKLESHSDADFITTHASITAKPFFEKNGYRVVRENTVVRQGVELKNYIMKKPHKPHIVKDVRHSDIKRTSFIKLAKNTFGISFSEWYEQGYWTDRYCPYTIFDGNTAVSNASANIIKTRIDGTSKAYIQIGTVMTHPEYRHLGLARMLINEIISDFESKVDGIYLYANDTVLNFYPRFGFTPEYEYSFSKEIIPSNNLFEKVDMKSADKTAMLKAYYQKGNPFSARQVFDNFELLMFYCGSFMQDCVYFSKELDCMAIASFEDDIMTCFDIFGNPSVKISLDTVLSSLSRRKYKLCELGFTPKDTDGFKINKIASYDYLFVLSSKENMFKKSKMRLPALSHA